MSNNRELPSLGTEHSDIHRIPIQSLVFGYSPRINGEDQRHIDILAQIDGPLPPILVQRETMRVIDGMHRLRAAILLGHESIGVRFFDGTDAEAFVAAVKANIEHGLPLTLTDRETAASRVVALYPERSDRWIADITGLAPGTIAAICRRIPGGDEAGRRIGRDGRVRPIDSADGRRMARDAIAKHPDASLRELARLAGVSPGTIRAVRKSIEQEEDPVTRKLPGGETGQRPNRNSADRETRNTDAFSSQTRDLGTLLHKLRMDPSLRFSETGRRLLNWLDSQASDLDKLEILVDSVPSHCMYLIVELARSYANEWLDAARRMQQRIDGMQ